MSHVRVSGAALALLTRKRDRLYRATVKAQGAMSEQVMVLHYLTCDGVGEPGRQQ